MRANRDRLIVRQHINRSPFPDEMPALRHPDTCFPNPILVMWNLKHNARALAYGGFAGQEFGCPWHRPIAAMLPGTESINHGGGYRSTIILSRMRGNSSKTESLGERHERQISFHS